MIALLLTCPQEEKRERESAEVYLGYILLQPLIAGMENSSCVCNVSANIESCLIQARKTERSVRSDADGSWMKYGASSRSFLPMDFRFPAIELTRIRCLKWRNLWDNLHEKFFDSQESMWASVGKIDPNLYTPRWSCSCTQLFKKKFRQFFFFRFSCLFLSRFSLNLDQRKVWILITWGGPRPPLSPPPFGSFQ